MVFMYSIVVLLSLRVKARRLSLSLVNESETSIQTTDLGQDIHP